MIQVEEIVNSIFNSKTYILYNGGENAAWLVDIGDLEPVLDFMESNHLTVKGVFITHGHFDHIYGLIGLVERYPNCTVYSTEFTKKALASSKLNLSRYHDAPFIYGKENIVVLHEGEQVLLFEGEPNVTVYETPGHNPGCMTMVLGNMVFTGDAYIPDVGVNTQLPYSDKALSQASLAKIKLLSLNRTILSGHQIVMVKNE